MNSERLARVVELTHECISRFWQMDVEFTIQYFHEDILWIGSAKSQYHEGYEAAAEDFRSIKKELIPCHLLQQSFTPIHNVGNSCTIVGRYITTCDDETEFFMQAEQRATFTWEYVEGKPLIKHIHVSNPMGELALAEGERVPNALGQMAKEYINYKFFRVYSSERLVVPDRSEATHYFTPGEIIYVKAVGRYCDIHTVLGDVVHARISIGELFNMMGDEFVVAHRSYVVNLYYVSVIRQYEVIMSNGDIIPVPVKKYTDLRARVNKIFAENEI